MTLNKLQLCKRFKEDTGCTYADAKFAIDTLANIIIEELLQDHKVLFGKLGTISLRHNKSRIGYNPSSMQKMNIPARKYVKIHQTLFVKNLLIDKFNK